MTGRTASTSPAMVNLHSAQFGYADASLMMPAAHQIICQVLKGGGLCCAGLQGSTSETNLPPVGDTDKDTTAPKPQPGALPRSLSTPHYKVRLILSCTLSNSQQHIAELVKGVQQDREVYQQKEWTGSCVFH